jgi:hypothetical protein
MQNSHEEPGHRHPGSFVFAPRFSLMPREHHSPVVHEVEDHLQLAAEFGQLNFFDTVP